MVRARHVHGGELVQHADGACGDDRRADQGGAPRPQPGESSGLRLIVILLVFRGMFCVEYVWVCYVMDGTAAVFCLVFETTLLPLVFCVLSVCLSVWLSCLSVCFCFRLSVSLSLSLWVKPWLPRHLVLTSGSMLFVARFSPTLDRCRRLSMPCCRGSTTTSRGTASSTTCSEMM